MRRDPANRVLGGVCAGIANRFGVDPLMVRVVVVVAAFFGGVGVALYALGWVALPAGDIDGRPAPRRAAIPRRGSVEVAVGAGFLILSLLLAIRQVGLPFSDALVWPLVLAALGVMLLTLGLSRRA